MIETIVSIDLFVDEKLEIKKNRLLPASEKDMNKRVCIVTGIHGDELEGQYVCFELIRRIKENPDLLTGIVDVYPALNPLGIDSISRGIPMFDLDMNRIFPGSENGAVAEYIASRIVTDIAGSDLCIDVHSSNIFLRELPQIRMSQSAAAKLLPYSELLNVDLIWVNPKEQVHHATLAHSLNEINVPTMVIEMGVGMHITKEYGDLLVDGILHVLKAEGIWHGDTSVTKTPRTISDVDLTLVSAGISGIFMPLVTHAAYVDKNTPLGNIIDPLRGEVLETLYAPCKGQIITLREYPLVYTGSLLARIFGGAVHE